MLNNLRDNETNWDSGGGGGVLELCGRVCEVPCTQYGRKVCKFVSRVYTQVLCHTFHKEITPGRRLKH